MSYDMQVTSQFMYTILRSANFLKYYIQEETEMHFMFIITM